MSQDRPGPRNNASSRLLMNAAVARSKTTAIHFRVEGKVEVIESPVGVAKGGLFTAALE